MEVYAVLYRWPEKNKNICKKAAFDTSKIAIDVCYAVWPLAICFHGNFDCLTVNIVKVQ